MHSPFKASVLVLFLVSLITIGIVTTILFSVFTKPRPAIPSPTKVLLSLPKAPPADASEKEKRAFQEILRDSSVLTTTISVNQNCTPNPLVAHIDMQRTFTVSNSDTIAHIVLLQPDLQLAILPGQSQTVPEKTLHNPGIFALRCDSDKSVHGYIFFTN